MQSLKKFYFGKQKAKVNTYIGGIGGTINTPALLASKLGISESRIKLFKVTGVDVECAVIGGSYSLPRYAFTSDQSITYYIDIDGLNTEIYQGLINCNNLKRLYFPNLTSLRGGLSGGWLTNQSLIRAYFPRLIYMGETVGKMKSSEVDTDILMFYTFQMFIGLVIQEMQMEIYSDMYLMVLAHLSDTSPTSPHQTLSPTYQQEQFTTQRYN